MKTDIFHLPKISSKSNFITYETTQKITPKRTIFYNE